MRKIKSMADIEKARRRNNIILGIIMIFLLTASSLGYSLMSADNNEKNIVSENGFDFVRDGGMWKLAIDDARAGVSSEEDKIFVFQNLPSEVDDINVNVTAQLGMYSGQPVYFVNPGEGVNEILSNIGSYVLRYQEACLRRDSVTDDLDNLTSGLNESANDMICEGDLPVKDCGSNLIVFEAGNETRVYSEGNCVFIVGDVVRGSDAFLYRILGVVN